MKNYPHNLNDKATDWLHTVVLRYADAPNVRELAQSFFLTWYYNIDCSTACDTIRRLLSDAIREAGCENEFVHHYILNSYGYTAARTILAHHHGVVDWHKMKLQYGKIDFEDETLKDLCRISHADWPVS